MSGLGDNPIIQAFAESVTPTEYVRLLSVTNNLCTVLGALDNMAKLQSADPKQRVQIAQQLDTAFSALSGAGEFAKGLIDRLGEDGIQAILNANVFSADSVNAVCKTVGSSPVIDFCDQRLTSFDAAAASLRKEIDQLLGQSHPAPTFSHQTACHVGTAAASAGLLLAGVGALAGSGGAVFFGGAAFGGGGVLMLEHCRLA
jgi:hypothetical protein